MRTISFFSRENKDLQTAIVTALLGGLLFYCSTKPAHAHFDYTFRIAGALLRGHAGVPHKPPSWLNEFVPMNGRYYSVFPLGAVLVNVPAALAHKVHLVRQWPARLTSAVIAAGCVYFFFRLTYLRPDLSLPRRVILAFSPVFATWAWCNLGFAGAWQIALGFAVLGEAAALYYTLVTPNPLAAGAWLALAIGNRTELLLTVPLFILVLIPRPLRFATGEWRLHLTKLGWFLAAPCLLLLLTATYNWARFGSPFDFGYARIPGLLKEPWYRQGVFSLSSIRWNAYEMLFRGVGDIPKFPYLKFYAFGCSIFLASPMLFLLFREGGRHRFVCWAAIGGLTLVLWAHGNPGGWQFSYRYGMILLPWIFVLITDNGPKSLSALETSLFAASIAINAVAAYEFLWTNMITI
jgi:hypothetical protein